MEDVAEIVDGEEACGSRQILEAVSDVGLAVDVAVVVVLQCGVEHVHPQPPDTRSLSIGISSH